MLCVAALAKLSKWALKSLAKFAPLGRPGVFPRNREGNVLGLMLWTSWAEDAAPKESTPPANSVSRSRFLRRGLKLFFQDFHVWPAFGFPSHPGRSLENELARRREDVAKAASKLSMLGQISIRSVERTLEKEITRIENVRHTNKNIDSVTL